MQSFKSKSKISFKLDLPLTNFERPIPSFTQEAKLSSGVHICACPDFGSVETRLEMKNALNERVLKK